MLFCWLTAVVSLEHPDLRGTFWYYWQFLQSYCSYCSGSFRMLWWYILKDVFVRFCGAEVSQFIFIFWTAWATTKIRYTFSLDPLVVKIQSGFFRDGTRYPTGGLVLHIRHRGNEKLLCAAVLWISTFLERNTPNRHYTCIFYMEESGYFL